MRDNRFVEKKQKLIQERLILLLRRYFSESSLSKITVTRVEMEKASDVIRVFYMPFATTSENLKKDLKTKIFVLQNRLYKSLNFKKPFQLKFIYDKGLDHLLKIDNILNDMGRQDTGLEKLTESDVIENKP